METLQNFAVHIVINGIVMAGGLALVAGLYKFKDSIFRFSAISRLLLIPVVALAALTAVTAISNGGVALLAVFWPKADVGSNIWFYANVIYPAASAYALIWGIHFTAPFHKDLISSAIGLVWCIFYVLIFYLAVEEGFLAGGTYLFDMFGLEQDLYGSIAQAIASVAGIFVALRVFREKPVSEKSN